MKYEDVVRILADPVTHPNSRKKAAETLVKLDLGLAELATFLVGEGPHLEVIANHLYFRTGRKRTEKLSTSEEDWLAYLAATRVVFEKFTKNKTTIERRVVIVPHEHSTEVLLFASSEGWTATRSGPAPTDEPGRYDMKNSMLIMERENEND